MKKMLFGCLAVLTVLVSVYGFSVTPAFAQGDDNNPVQVVNTPDQPFHVVVDRPTVKHHGPRRQSTSDSLGFENANKLDAVETNTADAVQSVKDMDADLGGKLDNLAAVTAASKSDWLDRFGGWIIILLALIALFTLIALFLRNGGGNRANQALRDAAAAVTSAAQALRDAVKELRTPPPATIKCSGSGGCSSGNGDATLPAGLPRFVMSGDRKSMDDMIAKMGGDNSNAALIVNRMPDGAHRIVIEGKDGTVTTATPESAKPAGEEGKGKVEETAPTPAAPPAPAVPDTTPTPSTPGAPTGA